MGLIAHRQSWLITPLTGLTSAIYTIPSISSFLLLLPITGRGNDTAIVALTAYTLVIIFRNVITGLAGVPQDAVDAARGMGLTSRQLLFRVELPLALPEIIAGLRIAAATTVGLAAFAYLAGAGGLGANIDSRHRLPRQRPRLRDHPDPAGRDAGLHRAERPAPADPVEAGGAHDRCRSARSSRRSATPSSSSSSGARRMPARSRSAASGRWAIWPATTSPSPSWRSWSRSSSRSRSACGSATSAAPSCWRVGVANVGRAVPALAIIGFCVAFLGTGFRNIAFALTLLAIPPILTNTYVGMRQVDPELVDAARGQGLSGFQVVRQVEWPLALPTIFGGIRISVVTVLATAIISPIAGLDSLGTPIFSEEIYGTEGVLAAAIARRVPDAGHRRRLRRRCNGS